MSKDTRMNISLRNGVYTDSFGNETNLTLDNFTAPHSLILFGLWDQSYYIQPHKFSSVQLYNLKLYDGNTLIRNYIPCYRKSDNTIGLYDVVNGIFYQNKGSGTFGKGNNVDAGYITSATQVARNEDHTIYAIWESYSKTFYFTGEVEEYIVPKTAYYKIEAYGLVGAEIR